MESINYNTYKIVCFHKGEQYMKKIKDNRIKTTHRIVKTITSIIIFGIVISAGSIFEIVRESPTLKY